MFEGRVHSSGENWIHMLLILPCLAGVYIHERVPFPLSFGKRRFMTHLACVTMTNLICSRFHVLQVIHREPMLKMSFSCVGTFVTFSWINAQTTTTGPSGSDSFPIKLELHN